MTFCKVFDSIPDFKYVGYQVKIIVTNRQINQEENLSVAIALLRELKFQHLNKPTTINSIPIYLTVAQQIN